MDFEIYIGFSTSNQIRFRKYERIDLMPFRVSSGFPQFRSLASLGSWNILDGVLHVKKGGREPRILNLIQNSIFYGLNWNLLQNVTAFLTVSTLIFMDRHLLNKLHFFAVCRFAWALGYGLMLPCGVIWKVKTRFAADLVPWHVLTTVSMLFQLMSGDKTGKGYVLIEK